MVLVKTTIGNVAEDVPHGVGIIVIKNGKLAVSKRLQAKKMTGYWQFPGGSIEPRETPEQAAQRELKEETGLDLPVERFHKLGRDFRTNPYTYVGHAFAVYLGPDENVKNMEKDKMTDWEWICREDLYKLQMILGTKKYVKPALAHYDSLVASIA